MTDETDASPRSFYDEVGGHETFVRLVDGFYRGVATDEVLKPMYPEEDLGPAAERLTLFLEQYWGGPTTYSERRGHPRLRARHNPFHVNPDARDRWLRHMRASLDDLNSRLPEPVSMVRFRPNFVISGATPFAEDQWTNITIGNLNFQIVKPCARCVLTTINPETAEKGAEPLKTLASYRRVNNKVLFGQNMVAKDLGTVREGDQIIVSERVNQ